MNPASLSPALFAASAAPAAAATAGPACATAGALASSTEGGGGFARLLQPEAASPANADTVPAQSPGTATATLAETAAEAEPLLEDAPWPPAGLEQLLAAPQASDTPAPGEDTGTGMLAGALMGSALPAVAGPADIAQPLLPAAAAGSAGMLQAAPLAAKAPGLLPANAAAAAHANTADATLDPAALVAPAEGEIPLDSLKAAGMEPTASNVNLSTPAADTGSFAPMLALSAAAPGAPSAASAPASVLPTAATLGGEQFGQDVAQGVEYMLDHKLQSARIRISPEQMGMIDVELRLDGERVHAHFVSAHAEVRQALNDSLPRLRELLDAQGLQMGQAGVGSQGADDAAQTAQQGTGQTGGAGQPDAGQAAAPAAPAWRRAGLLDAYA